MSCLRKMSKTTGLLILAFCLVFPAVGLSTPVQAQEPVLVTFEGNYGNGSLWYRYTAYKSGWDWIRHGVSTEWYQNGQMQTQGRYKNGAKDDIWTAWDDTGIKRSEIAYESGMLHGPYTEWFASGQMAQQGEYLAGQKDGMWTTWDGTGTKHSETQYRDGVRHGTEKIWYGDGKMQSQIEYKYGQKDGPYSTWFSTGLRSFEGQYLQDFKDGVWKQYYQNGGGLEYVTTYRDDVRHGPEDFYTWEPPGYVGGYNGKVYERTQYVNGIVHGTFTKFFASGNVMYKTEYLDGVKQGAFGSWYDSGSANVVGQYRDGEPRGTWDTWSEDGQYHSTSYYGPAEPIVIHAETYTKTTPTAKDIRGTVTNAQTGRPVAGAAIKAGSYQATSGASGAYKLTLGTDNSYSLSVSRTGFYTHSQNLDMQGYDYKTVNVKLKKDGPKPAITKVQSKYGKMFFEGISVNNDYTVSVDWKGQPGKLKVNINGTAYEFNGTQADAVLSFDMGTVPFRAGNAAETNILRITAQNSEGIESDPEILHPVVVPIPDWSRGLGIFAGVPGQQYKYVLKAQWPKEPVEIQVNEKALGPTLWVAWGLFPFIGGRNFGIPPSAVALEVEANVDGSGSIAGTGQSGMEAAGATITGKLGAKGNAQYEPGKGFSWTGADLILGIGGEIKTERGPVTLIPALEGAVNLPVVGRPIRWFNDVAKIVGTISTEATITPQAINDQGTISFNKMEGEFKAGISLGLAFEMSENIKAEVTGGGVDTVTYQFPADPGYLKKVEAQLYAKLALQIWLITQEFQATHAFTYSSEPSATAFASDPKPMSRDFLDRTPYSRFVANAAPRSAAGPHLLGVTAGSAELRLIQNVFPYSEPAIAEKDGKLGIAFVYFNPAIPTLQATDISLIYYDGANYTAPKSVLTDTRAEFAPSIAFDQSGKIVAAWQRIKDENFSGQSTLDMARAMEIVYAAYTPSSDSWSQPVALTDNTYLDHSPMLVRGLNGNLMLLWQSNEGNELIGDSVSPTTVHYATWNGQGFDAPGAVSTTFEDSFGFSAAYDGANAILAYVKDMDGDLLTTQDEEVFYVSFNGAAWGSPIRLTSDSEADVSPRTIYRSDGVRELVWLKGNRLVRLTDWTTGAYQVIREGSDSITFANFKLVRDGQDRLVLLWQNIDDKGVDLFYNVYDPANNVWSGDLRLTEDKLMEKDFNGVFSADGALKVVYNKDNLDTRANDLYLLTHNVSADLALSPTGLSVQPENPSPGESVTLAAQVENSGDVAEGNVSVAFYLGASADPSKLIGTATVQPALLKAGDKGTASLSWTVPQTSETYNVYAKVDPQNAVAEADETNNAASFNVVKPDLEAAGLRMEKHGDGSVDMVAVVQNNGLGVAANVEVSFRAAGTDLGVIRVASILPGATGEVTHTTWANVDFETSEVVVEAVADPQDKIVETNEDNNHVFTLLTVAPQITVQSTAIDLGRAIVGSSSNTVSVALLNTGDLNLVLGNLSVTGANASEFSLHDDSSSGQTLAPSQIRTVSVVFSPTSTGTKSAVLAVPSNDPTTPTLNIGLGGTGMNPAGPLHHIIVTPANPSIQVGGSQTFTATTYDQDNNERLGDGIFWSMANAAAGAINVSTGVFSAGTLAGSYDNVIEATSGSVTGATSVTLTPGLLDHIAVSPSHPDVVLTQSQTFAAATYDQYDNLRTGDAITWACTDAGAGAINASSGVFTATGNPANLGEHPDVIQATSGAKTGVASVNIIGGIINGTVTLQGGSRPASARAVSLTMRLFTPGTSNTDLAAGTGALVSGTATAVDGGTNTVSFAVVGVPPGDYDITLKSNRALMNVKKNVTVAAGINAVTFGTLLEGDANNDGIINAVDFSILAASYLKFTGQTEFDARADCDVNGLVNALDFSLLAANYLKNSPIVAP